MHPCKHFPFIVKKKTYSNTSPRVPILEIEGNAEKHQATVARDLSVLRSQCIGFVLQTTIPARIRLHEPWLEPDYLPATKFWTSGQEKARSVTLSQLARYWELKSLPILRWLKIGVLFNWPLVKAQDEWSCHYFSPLYLTNLMRGCSSN